MLVMADADDNRELFQRLATILLVPSVLIGAFLGLQASSNPAEDPAAQPTSVPSIPTPTPSSARIEVDAYGYELANLLGDVTPIVDIMYGDDVRALLVCDAEDRQLDFVQIETVDGSAFVAARTVVTSGLRWPCSEGGCGIGTSDLLHAAGVVVFGTCSDGGSNGRMTAFVIAPPAHAALALGIVVSCGGTFLEHDGDELVLRSFAPRAGSAEPVFWQPPLRLSFSSTYLWVDDEELLRKYCSLREPGRLVRSPAWAQFPGYQQPISTEGLPSELGVVDRHGPLLVLRDADVCQTVTETYWDNAWSDAPRTGVVAELIGVPPPEGEDDWYFTCHG